MSYWWFAGVGHLSNLHEMLVVTVALRSVSEAGILCNTQYGSRWSFTWQYLQGCFCPFHFLKEVAVSYSTDCLRLCFVHKKYSFCWTSWKTRTGAILQLMEREMWICEEAGVVMLELRLSALFLHPGCFAGSFLPCRYCSWKPTTWWKHLTTDS